MTEKLTEKARAATCPENRGCLPVVCVCDYVEDLADRVEELEARLAGVDAGTHVIVPVEPTEEMLAAGTRTEFWPETWAGTRDLQETWKTMIRAAQEKDDEENKET